VHPERDLRVVESLARVVLFDITLADLDRTRATLE
jgi:hypothetical protein